MLDTGLELSLERKMGYIRELTFRPEVQLVQQPFSNTARTGWMHLQISVPERNAQLCIRR
ncbi:hypothetical protein D3C85_1861840 [compost metagenome]